MTEVREAHARAAAAAVVFEAADPRDGWDRRLLAYLAAEAVVRPFAAVRRAARQLLVDLGGNPKLARPYAERAVDILTRNLDVANAVAAAAAASGVEHPDALRQAAFIHLRRSRYQLN